ncbi:MAG: hypothetical protein WCG01_00800 [bacterium]
MSTSIDNKVTDEASLGADKLKKLTKGNVLKMQIKAIIKGNIPGKENPSLTERSNYAKEVLSDEAFKQFTEELGKETRLESATQILEDKKNLENLLVNVDPIIKEIVYNVLSGNEYIQIIAAGKDTAVMNGITKIAKKYQGSDIILEGKEQQLRDAIKSEMERIMNQEKPEQMAA